MLTGYAIPHNPAGIAAGPTALEHYFAPFRTGIIGRGQTFASPWGEKEILYADWTASGRAYHPIEACIQNEIMPFVANTHTEATVTGALMSNAYEEAKAIVKRHVNARSDDALLFCGSGMTAAVNKLQRILGLRIPDRVREYMPAEDPQETAAWKGKLINRSGKPVDWLPVDETLRPVVFVTHMEHHSNHISWLETIATVEIIQPAKNGNVDLLHFRSLLERYKHRKNKIAAITACSNVTGIQTPYHQMAKLVHAYGGLCFVDFACSAPYVTINMHPADKSAALDAIYFSPHKFLGGPGAAGVLLFTTRLYKNAIPDQPGGGTVVYTNPWRVHEYSKSIEEREDGGTPPFLQGIKAAMCVRLKEAMGVDNMLRREVELLEIVFNRFSKMDNVQLLEGNIKSRLGIISFMVKGAHYNLIVQLLNDRFGIQTRGGCSCAGTYGHLLLRVDEARSYEIRKQIHLGNLQCKPGWTRLSLHPTMTNAEVHAIMDAIEQTTTHFPEWSKAYTYHAASNQYIFNGVAPNQQGRVQHWFTASTRCE